MTGAGAGRGARRRRPAGDGRRGRAPLGAPRPRAARARGVRSGSGIASISASSERTRPGDGATCRMPSPSLAIVARIASGTLVAATGTSLHAFRIATTWMTVSGLASSSAPRSISTGACRNMCGSCEIFTRSWRSTSWMSELRSRSTVSGAIVPLRSKAAARFAGGGGGGSILPVTRCCSGGKPGKSIVGSFCGQGGGRQKSDQRGASDPTSSGAAHQRRGAVVRNRLGMAARRRRQLSGEIGCAHHRVAQLVSSIAIDVSQSRPKFARIPDRGVTEAAGKAATDAFFSRERIKGPAAGGSRCSRKDPPRRGRSSHPRDAVHDAGGRGLLRHDRGERTASAGGAEFGARARC